MDEVVRWHMETDDLKLFGFKVGISSRYHNKVWREDDYGLFKVTIDVDTLRHMLEYNGTTYHRFDDARPSTSLDECRSRAMALVDQVRMQKDKIRYVMGERKLQRDSD